MTNGARPWLVDDALWALVAPLLPVRPRRARHPGRRPLDDSLVLQGILFVMHTEIGWEHLPQEFGFGSGMTAWRCLRSSASSGGGSDYVGRLLRVDVYAVDGSGTVRV